MRPMVTRTGLKASISRLLALVAPSLLILTFVGCGGGGGTSTSTALLINGTVTVPSGTPRSRDLTGGSPLPDAVIRAYLTTQPDKVIAEGTTDSDGRYTLRLPADAIGKDLLIVAEKQVSGQRVRVSALVAALPPEGYAGANLDVFTTLATEEILRYAREHNISRLSPNGIASVVDQVRERLRDRNSLSLVVGTTLPETIGEGILDEALRNQVRPSVEQNGNNLRPPEGDVAVAKSMMQMLRDFGVSGRDRGESEALRIERKVREQEAIVRRDISEPLRAFNDRGFRFFSRVFGLGEESEGIDGLPPARYREVQIGWRYRLERTDNAPDNRTWIVQSVDGSMTCTVKTQNTLSAFNLLDSGGVTFAVRKQSDSQFKYDGSLQATQHDSQNNITQAQFNFSFADGQLRQPIVFTGTLNAGAYTDGVPHSAQFAGTLSSQFADLTITGLSYEAYQASGQPKSISATRIQVTLKSERNLSLELQNFTAQFADAAPAEKNIQRITVGSLTSAGLDSTLTLRGWVVEFRRVGGQSLLPVAMGGELEYRAPNDTLSGTFEANWENPVETSLLEQRWIPLEQFPRGAFAFSGRLQPAIGRPMQLQFTLTFAPQQSPPSITLTPRFDLGSERMEGTVRGTLKVQGGMVDTRSLFGTGSIQMSHSPSGFQIQLTVAEDGTVSGSIKKSDGSQVAQIGNAHNLGLPDLGDQAIIKYSDGTFETLASLML
jgi:hypothetical protein